jgi:anion-transporting  ArsA/GET3 family ATPase
MAVTALVVNRVQPRFADDAELASLTRSASGSGSGSSDGATADGGSANPLDQLIDNLRGYTDASDREEKALADLVSKVSPAPVYRVPLLNTDVHDLDGLETIADLLFSRPPAAVSGGVDTER